MQLYDCTNYKLRHYFSLCSSRCGKFAIGCTQFSKNGTHEDQPMIRKLIHASRILIAVAHKSIHFVGGCVECNGLLKFDLIIEKHTTTA